MQLLYGTLYHQRDARFLGGDIDQDVFSHVAGF
jgi:hypothetical protein